MPTIKTTSLSRKTLVQKTNQQIRGQNIIDFVKKAGLPEFQDVQGAYIEFQDVIGVRAGYFNKYAFIQSDSNLNSKGSGLQANNRQEVDKQWLQSFYFPMPNPDMDDNIDYFVNNYRINEYKDKLLDEHFIKESFENLDHSFELLYANRFIFGHDHITTLMDGTTTKQHYNGLVDLVKACKQDTAITDIDTIEVMGTTNSRNIDLSATTITDLNAFSQLNNLENKMANVNSVFAFGNSQDGQTRWINNGNSQIKFVCWNSLIEKMKARNYQFYKELENLYSTGKLIKLPESSISVEPQNRDETNTGIAIPYSIGENDESFGLKKDEILLYDANGIVAFEYALGENGEQIFTQNNITESHKKLRMCAVSDVLPTTACAIVKVPALFNLTQVVNP